MYKVKITKSYIDLEFLFDCYLEATQFIHQLLWKSTEPLEINISYHYEEQGEEENEAL